MSQTMRPQQVLQEPGLQAHCLLAQTGTVSPMVTTDLLLYQTPAAL